MDDRKFSYGQLTAPHPDDSEFESEADTIEAAYTQSLGVSSKVYGIWQNGTGEILAIVYDGQIFKTI